MGFIGSVFAVSSVLGPLLGGFFVDNLSWRWVFYVNLPIGIAALFVVATRLHLPRHKERKPVDWLGFGLLTPAVVVPGPHDLVGRQPVRVGLGDDHRPRRRRRRARGPVHVVGAARRRPADPAAAVLEPRLRRRERDGLHRRPGDVRRPDVPAAVPAGRPRRQPDGVGAAADPADGRAAHRVDPVGAVDQQARALPRVPDHRHGDPRGRHDAADAAGRPHAVLPRRDLHGRHRRRHRPGDAGAGARRPERRAAGDMGAATSTAQFFRSIGGSVGVAVFGAIFASRLTSGLGGLPAGVATASAPPAARCRCAPTRSTRCRPASARTS